MGLYRKTRQKARKILEQLEQLKVPHEEVETSPSPERRTSSSKSFFLWLSLSTLFFTLFLSFSLRHWWLSSPKVTFPLKVLYGTDGLYQLPDHFAEGQKYTLRTAESSLALSIEEVGQIQLAPHTIVEILLSSSGDATFALRKGCLYGTFLSSATVSLPGIVPITFLKASGWVEVREASAELGVLRGQVQVDEKVWHAIIRLKWQGQWQKEPWQLPSWLLPLPSFPEIVAFVSSSTTRPTATKNPLKDSSFSRKDTVPTPSKNKIPAYPYHPPKWKRELLQKLRATPLPTYDSRNLLQLWEQIRSRSPVTLRLDPSLSLQEAPLTKGQMRNLNHLWAGLKFLAKQLQGQVLLVSPSEVLLASPSVPPNLTLGEKVQLCFRHIRSFWQQAEKVSRTPSLETQLIQTLVTLSLPKGTVAQALKQMSRVYPPGVYTDQNQKAKLPLPSLQFSQTPLEEVLQKLSELTGLAYAPENLEGRICLTTSERASQLWQKYRQSRSLLESLLPQEQFLRSQLLERQLHLPSKKWTLPELLEEIERQTSVKIFPERALWEKPKRVSLQGKFSLGTLLSRLQPHWPHRSFAVTTDLLRPFLPPTLQQIQLPEGLYLLRQ